MKKYTKYILSAISSIVGIASLSGCDDFLNETPNKSGSAYIYHMDQLNELSGSLDLYLFSSTANVYISYGITGDYMSDQIFMTDAIDIDPEYYLYGLKGSSNNYLLWTLNNEEMVNNQYRMATTWTPSWERIYRFNTILYNVDKVEQTTQQSHDQIAGEAYFGRAYYHFILLTSFCLWDENQPGIGYRDGINPGDIPERETVGYTLGKIYDDLAKSEELLTRAGCTGFNLKTNFRPTVPTVKALRARIDLYRGKYDSALKNANEALAAHNTLVSFKDDPNYTLSPSTSFNLLNDDNSAIKGIISSNIPYSLWNLKLQPVTLYDELYLPSMTTGDFCPVSERVYNLFDRENDARWIYFYNSNYPLLFASGTFTKAQIDGVEVPYCITSETQKWLKPQHAHCYYRFHGNGSVKMLGMTTAEMMLIKAECLARSGKNDEAAQVLKDLRATRFMNAEAANNIGGSVQDVLDERERELTNIWRFYDIKRLNGAENAGISINRVILSNPKDINSKTILTIAPDDPRWAMPIYRGEVANMGWEQNKGWN